MNVTPVINVSQGLDIPPDPFKGLGALPPLLSSALGSAAHVTPEDRRWALLKESPHIPGASAFSKLSGQGGLAWTSLGAGLQFPCASLKVAHPVTLVGFGGARMSMTSKAKW
jgi:hypothetical protein